MRNEKNCDPKKVISLFFGGEKWWFSSHGIPIRKENTKKPNPGEFCSFNCCFWSMNKILDPLDPHVPGWMTLALRHKVNLYLVTGASNPRGSKNSSERVESAGLRCSSAWPPSEAWLDVSPGFWLLSQPGEGTSHVAVCLALLLAVLRIWSESAGWSGVSTWQLFWPAGRGAKTSMDDLDPQPYTNHRPSPSMSGCWFYMGVLLFVHLFFL